MNGPEPRRPPGRAESVTARADRVRALVGIVARRTLADWGAKRLALLDDGSPEADLAAEWLSDSLAADSVVRVSDPGVGVESLLQTEAGETGRERAWIEGIRLRARMLPDTLVAHPANKTALLLGGALPPEPFLPLGDLYASEVAELAGGWSAPPEVRALAERVGGVGRLDEALRNLLDERDPRGLRGLGPADATAVQDALSRGRPSRVGGRIVPKIGYRTLGVDLFL